MCISSAINCIISTTQLQGALQAYTLVTAGTHQSNNNKSGWLLQTPQVIEIILNASRSHETHQQLLQAIS